MRALRNRGADVVSAKEAGMLAQSDEKQLQWALENRRVIYSFNVKDFYRIHSDWLTRSKSHQGIILGKQDYSVGNQMRGLLQIAGAKSAEQMINNVLFLGVWMNR